MFDLSSGRGAGEREVFCRIKYCVPGIGEGKSKGRRDKAICESYTKYGYTMKEIAEHLGLHYTAVSRGIKRADEK